MEDRYSRQIKLIEEKGQDKLKEARVLIVGAGGLGSAVALYLAGAGVGEIGIVDYDVVEVSNLQRQVIHDTDSVGKKKTESAKERLKKLNPEIKINEIDEKISYTNGFDIIKNYDIVVDGSDNLETRYAINEICVKLNKPIVYGAVLRFEGQVAVFNYNKGPCLRCFLTEVPIDSDKCEEVGVLGSVVGTIGTLQATEVVKIIIGEGEILSGKLLSYNGLSSKFETININKRSDCKICNN
tara:strand:+ start:89080 stop:89799 length:720 start_codon:yes stop_codon:yes gene_type:complete